VHAAPRVSQLAVQLAAPILSSFHAGRLLKTGKKRRKRERERERERVAGVRLVLIELDLVSPRGERCGKRAIRSLIRSYVSLRIQIRRNRGAARFRTAVTSWRACLQFSLASMAFVEIDRLFLRDIRASAPEVIGPGSLHHARVPRTRAATTQTDFPQERRSRLLPKFQTRRLPRPAYARRKFKPSFN